MGKAEKISKQFYLGLTFVRMNPHAFLQRTKSKILEFSPKGFAINLLDLRDVKNNQSPFFIPLFLLGYLQIINLHPTRFSFPLFRKRNINLMINSLKDRKSTRLNSS